MFEGAGRSRALATGEGAGRSRSLTAGAERTASHWLEFVRPPLEAEQGDCWARVKRLNPSQIAAIEQAWLARNPGWSERLAVDPFSGRVTHAELKRQPREDAVTVFVPEQRVQLRRGLLWSNADFLGMLPDEILAIGWEHHIPKYMPGGYSVGAVMRSSPEFTRMGKHAGMFQITVHFADNGMPERFSIALDGPPVPICTVPHLTETEAKASPSLFDRTLQPAPLGHFSGGFDVVPYRVDDAHVELIREDPIEWHKAESLTWRLAWGVNVHNSMWTFYVDAASGQVFWMTKNFVE